MFYFIDTLPNNETDQALTLDWICVLNCKIWEWKDFFLPKIWSCGQYMWQVDEHWNYENMVKYVTKPSAGFPFVQFFF